MFSTLGLLAFTASALHADNPPSPYVQVKVIRLGSEPRLFEFDNSTTGPITNNSTGPLSVFDNSADYGLLTANLSGAVPTTGNTVSVSNGISATWVDTLTFSAANTSLTGIATAHFLFQLDGNWSHSFATGADGSSITYNMTINGVDYGGYYAANEALPRGEINIANYSLIPFDVPFNLGSSVDLNVVLSEGLVLESSASGSSSGNVHLTFAETSLQVFDGGNNTIAGTWSTLSGHDYTVSAIPEPATWALVPAVIGLVVATRRRKVKTAA
ncbi:MAG TPA: PEP-CTERM sorting domain-containing protein [Opitutales bacterium]|nr:PEP-CTERM sorting domain-containing protein [Opitutales bacterium]